MRIAVVSNTAWYLFNFRLNLMQALRGAGHSVLAIAPLDAYAQRFDACEITFEDVRISGGGTNPLVEFGSVLALRQVLRRHAVDLVLSYTPKGNLYSALACMSLGIPFAPNVSGLGRAFVRSSPVTWVVQLLYKITFRRAYRVFFQNQDDFDTFLAKRLALAHKSERLPGSGVDLVRFTPQPDSGHPTDQPVFLLIARMLWDKGVGEYVAAARVVRRRFPAARFQLLGFLDVSNPSAITRQQMDEWTAEGVVEFLGHTDDVRPMLASADCVVLPSKYREGVPRTLLEAAAMARPVITTDAPGCRDTVRDGETGFLVQVGDAGDLVEKLMRFIGLTAAQRREMGRNARSFVESKFDESLVLRRYLLLVQEVSSR